MPRKWSAHWEIEDGPLQELERNRLVHTFGNLTLLTGRLNSKVSNGPWTGVNSKRAGIQEHDVLFLNRDVLKLGEDGWNEERIRQRTKDLTEVVIATWPVPEGHRSVFSGEVARHQRPVEVVDLISAGLLEPGQMLYPRSQNPRDLTATILGDGSLEVDGQTFAYPSGAGAHIAGHAINGWWLFLVDPGPARRSLRTIRREYLDSLALDGQDDDDGLEEDED